MHPHLRNGRDLSAEQRLRYCLSPAAEERLRRIRMSVASNRGGLPQISVARNIAIGHRSLASPTPIEGNITNSSISQIDSGLALSDPRDLEHDRLPPDEQQCRRAKTSLHDNESAQRTQGYGITQSSPPSAQFEPTCGELHRTDADHPGEVRSLEFGQPAQQAVQVLPPSSGSAEQTREVALQPTAPRLQQRAYSPTDHGYASCQQPVSEYGVSPASPPSASGGYSSTRVNRFSTPSSKNACPGSYPFLQPRSAAAFKEEPRDNSQPQLPTATLAAAASAVSAVTSCETSSFHTARWEPDGPPASLSTAWRLPSTTSTPLSVYGTPLHKPKVPTPSRDLEKIQEELENTLRSKGNTPTSGRRFDKSNPESGDELHMFQMKGKSPPTRKSPRKTSISSDSPIGLSLDIENISSPSSREFLLNNLNNDLSNDAALLLEERLEVLFSKFLSELSGTVEKNPGTLLESCVNNFKEVVNSSMLDIFKEKLMPSLLDKILCHIGESPKEKSNQQMVRHYPASSQLDESRAPHHHPYQNSNAYYQQPQPPYQPVDAQPQAPFHSLRGAGRSWNLSMAETHRIVNVGKLRVVFSKFLSNLTGTVETMPVTLLESCISNFKEVLNNSILEILKEEFVRITAMTLV
ncbi:hypothetical protein PTTG_04756 [Puccinia triticina 1-1 BBBD Race 1]|uniref:Uncharacterized protein n=1 Tax=Puccinia triticina (isolate 1-1 / race 1 (BBBD)) TaxID=630390 RepID=A0A180GSZ1_PUCT1|nr:hypothetical protein PTTG_04756 [Puccinia triticina 1-1 BBBD Race 1]